ncbi:MAG: YetF domain-containing protein [Bacteroidota bacterium]
MNAYIEIIGRALAVYAFILLALRLLGKKELSQLSVADLVLIMLVSNAVQNAMVGSDISLLGGIIAAAVLFVVDFVIKQITYRSIRFKTIIEGTAVLLIYKGQIQKQNLANEKITLSELDTIIREHGISSIEEVELCMLETDGNISVISKSLTNQHFYPRKHRPLHKKYRK